ncbi:MAG: GspE/PulE family protein [Deltaproteobacteria bacterium]|nr:GspE/PulE family protein [Deltaproteobacteria bacterium]
MTISADSRIERKVLSLDFVCSLLVKNKLLSEENRKELMIKGESQRARMQKAQQAPYSRQRLLSYAPYVTAAEVIASFELDIPGSPGKILTEDKITELLAPELGLPYIKIDPLKLDMDFVTAQIPRPFAQRHLMIPLGISKEGVLMLAVTDPSDTEALADLQRMGKKEVSLSIASKTDIVKIVREFFGFRSSVMAAQKERGKDAELNNLEQYVKLKGAAEIEATDQHVVNAVEYILRYAYEQRASDIHIEPKRKNSLVRLRIDGVLHQIHTIPKIIHPSIVSRIKMMSRMDIAEKRKPQDGRIKTEHETKEVELRVSTLPTAFGEKVVMRIFDPEIVAQDIRTLGFTANEFSIFESYLQKPHGIILVTGPTGSGKTTTLYSALKYLSSPEVNITTIEDPIEMVFEDFNQIGVQPLIGVDFASSLRTILRQDPDIIMVGEIRDKETATNAVQAALTGHLVFSTLHTNDAPSSLTRLNDLGVQPFLISATIIGIMAQRLVRKICKHCKQERILTTEEMAYLNMKPTTYKVYYGTGCVECRGTGYKGRCGIYEIMSLSDQMKSHMEHTIDLPAITRIAKADGMKTLRESAIRRMLEGITTYEEIVSITN